MWTMRACRYPHKPKQTWKAFTPTSGNGTFLFEGDVKVISKYNGEVTGFSVMAITGFFQVIKELSCTS